MHILTAPDILIHVAVMDVCCALAFALTIALMLIHAGDRPKSVFWLVSGAIYSLTPWFSIVFMLGFCLALSGFHLGQFGLLWGAGLVLVMLAHIALAVGAGMIWLRTSRRLWMTWSQFRRGSVEMV